MDQKLTRHPEGSIRELATLSFPLMISAFASLCMIFTDRLFLARYSIEALDAVANAGTLSWAFISGVGTITAMSEVFVAQYNGAQRHEQIGVAVWQTIWLSLISFIVFIPGAYFAPQFFAFDPNKNLEIGFFRLLMIFGPSYALMTAFAGFFVGRGKTKVLIAVALIANSLNILLDWLLIFGLPPYIPALGITGAAIATSMGYLSQAAILAVMFFRKKYRAQFGTTQWHFNFDVFRKCCKVGGPQGMFVALEILGWALFYSLMTSISKTHITVSAICQSLLILFSFFGDGLSRGIAAAAGNFIGSRRYPLVYHTMRSGLMIQGLFSILIAIVLLFDSKDLMQFLFFEHMKSAETSNMLSHLHICLVFTFFYMFFEGIRWLFSGLLTAAGDTIFLMITGSLSVWVGCLLPVYLIVVRHQCSVEIAWLIACLYSMTFFGIYVLRFHLGAWKKINLLQESDKDIGIESVSSDGPKN